MDPVDLRKPPARQEPPEGCLVVAIRMPVRVAVLVLVLPVRMAWDALAAAGRFVTRTVLRPAGRALVWLAGVLLVRPAVVLWRYGVLPLCRALAWLGRVLLVVPVVLLYRSVLAPVGHALALLASRAAAALAWLYARVLTPFGHAALRLLRGTASALRTVALGACTAVAWLVRYAVVVPVAWLVRYVVVVPGVWLVRHLVVAPARCLYARILTPVGRAAGRLAGLLLAGVGLGLYWVGRVLLVLPASALWRWVLVPVGRLLALLAREVAEALGHAWRVAGRISVAVGRLLGTLFRWIFVEPVRWAYRTVLTPVGHLLRDAVLRPAAEAARTAGRAGRQALAAARETVRQVRADVRRALFGRPPEREAVGGRESQSSGARTLGRSTTALTKD
ncbi:hypothetical protein [Streptomyces sp. bgisy153]|uniref:hypothetical protein n=1 Tax=Streptomyces sp. bgisy153 TaxID=3413793 RepID=UPI003D747A45